VIDAKTLINMSSTRLDQKPAGYFAKLFDERRITLHPGSYRSGVTFRCGDDERSHYGAIRIEGGEFPFQFSMYFPATASEVREHYIETARSVLENLAELDASARQPIAGDDHSEDYDMDRDVYLAYIHVEHNRVELQYYWDPFNGEFTACFSRQEDGSWVFDGV